MGWSKKPDTSRCTTVLIRFMRLGSVPSSGTGGIGSVSASTPSGADCSPPSPRIGGQLTEELLERGLAPMQLPEQPSGAHWPCGRSPGQAHCSPPP